MDKVSDFPRRLLVAIAQGKETRVTPPSFDPCEPDHYHPSCLAWCVPSVLILISINIQHLKGPSTTRPIAMSLHHNPSHIPSSNLSIATRNLATSSTIALSRIPLNLPLTPSSQHHLPIQHSLIPTPSQHDKQHRSSPSLRSAPLNRSAQNIYQDQPISRTSSLLVKATIGTSKPPYQIHTTRPFDKSKLLAHSQARS